MNKVLVVAGNEIGSAVRTKSFLIGVLLMPLIMVGAGVGGSLAGRQTDLQARKFAVIDRSKALYPAIRQAAEQRDQFPKKPDGTPMLAPFVPSEASPGANGEDALLLDLSDRVRRGELYAFVEIPADVVHPARPMADPIRYHSNSPNEDELRRWLEGAVNAGVQTLRLRDAGIDPERVRQLQGQVQSENLGLLSRGDPMPAKTSPGAPGPTGQGAAGGGIVQAEKVDPVRTVLVPMILMVLVFFVVMTSGPQLFNSVIEEKMSKISEVLLGSVSPFELMAGKLLGNAGIAATLALIYVVGGYGVAWYFGYGNAVTPYMVSMLALSLTLAILLYGSLFAAVGAACSDLKDSQSLLTPVILMATLPMMLLGAVVSSPNSPLAVGLSLFPFSSPYVMLLRMNLNPSPPFWQVGLAAALTTLTALACVWASAKVFRTGLLMQGKAPGIRELVRWVFAR